ncbi:hypothetical protein MASR2M8_24950 [Opitutaceae bacterium]
MNSPDLILIAGGVLIIAYILFSNRSRLPLDQAHAALKSGHAVLVDVREPHEWRHGMAADAFGLPLSDLRGTRAQWKPFLAQHAGKRLFLYCQSGARSAAAAASLRREGFDALNVGSFSAWRRSGWPVKN